MIQEQVVLKILRLDVLKLGSLIKRGTFRAVPRAELPNCANMIAAKHLLLIKSNWDKEEAYKARSVAGKRLDIIKDYLVHEA